MELFIESPHRVAERLERERLLRIQREQERLERQTAYAAQLDLDEPDAAGRSGEMGGAAPEVPAADAYREELAYDRHRARRRKVYAVVRVVAFIALVPVAAALVFLAAYSLTYIFNGAGPEELAAALTRLVDQVVSAGWEVLERLRE